MVFNLGRVLGAAVILTLNNFPISDGMRQRFMCGDMACSGSSVIALGRFVARLR